VKRILALAVLALTAGCSSSGGTSGSASSNPPAGVGNANTSSGSKLSGSLTVYAAASLTEAFDTIKAQFERAHPGTSVKVTYGASSDLATQITQGAPVDVFASASTKNMDAVVSANDASSPTNFVSNTLEIAVPPRNPAHISSVADLAKSGVKVAVCDPAVPCGVVAAQVFKNAKITVKPTANEADVKSTLAAVESGEVDAGLVYVTDVRSAGSKVKGVVIPDKLNASTTYPIAPLTHAGNPALATAFVDFVLSPPAMQVLMKDGFKNP
jgi:molybdate transport system substrate-binding protein